jgi:hypothetical protein
MTYQKSCKEDQNSYGSPPHGCSRCTSRRNHKGRSNLFPEELRRYFVARSESVSESELQKFGLEQLFPVDVRRRRPSPQQMH